MADYNSIHTGAQIDEGVGRALSGRAGINPNLLDNWYFGNPVNQRRQTEYTGAGYTIDRWYNAYANGVVTITDNGVTLGAFKWLIQRFENHDFIGKTITASVLFADGEFCYGTAVYNGGDVRFCASGGYAVHVEVVDNGGTTDPEFRLVNFGETAEKTIVAVKLELGSTQTLAYQDEAGNWVLNEIPNYAEELAKCQRYQQVFCGEGSGYAPLFNGYFHSDVSARFAIPLSVPMAKKPSIVYVNEALLTSFSIRGDGATRAMASLAISYTPNTNVMSLHAVVSGATANNACAFITNGLRGILLDANL